MSRRDKDYEAVPAPLPASAVEGLIFLTTIEKKRDETLVKLYGRKIRRSHLREALLRAVALEWSLGRIHSIAHYNKQVSEYGSASAVRLEINKLADMRVVFLRPDPVDARASRVVPSQRLMDYSREQIPRMMDEIRRVTK